MKPFFRALQATEAQQKYDELAQRFEEQDELMREAQVETELKRETASKLKNEVIDNDRLTVANLNRIKQLEAQLEAERGMVGALERENEELRDEETRKARAYGEQAEQLEALQELLQERESMVEELSQKLLDVRSPAVARRDSLLDRFGLAGSATRDALERGKDPSKDLAWKDGLGSGLRDNWNGVKDTWGRTGSLI